MRKALAVLAGLALLVPTVHAALGTLLIDDPAGDARPAPFVVDLRKVWFASDGTFLNVTIGAVDITPEQQRASYHVNMLRPDGIEEHPDTLGCEVGDQARVLAEPDDCRLSVITGHDHPTPNVHVLESEIHDAPARIDFEQDRIHVRIEYGWLNATSGDTLRDIDAWTMSCLFGTCSQSDDSDADAEYTLN